MAARRGNRVTRRRRVRRNQPAGFHRAVLSETTTLGHVLSLLDIVASAPSLSRFNKLKIQQAQKYVRQLQQQAQHGVHVNPRRNPVLAVAGMNPPRGRGRVLGHVTEVRYQHSGKDRGYYKHVFTSRPKLVGLPDGSLHITGRR